MNLTGPKVPCPVELIVTVPFSTRNMARMCVRGAARSRHRAGWALASVFSRKALGIFFERRKGEDVDFISYLLNDLGDFSMKRDSY
jgi:hypothetical protein